MSCVHIESDRYAIQQKPNLVTSNRVLSEHGEVLSEHDDGGIQEAWAQIKNRGNGGGGYFAGEGTSKLEKRKSQVLLKGYVDSVACDDDQDEINRAKSLTDDDLEELKGCLDLGFGFNYDEIPELCNTLPALELCYSMSQKFLVDEKQSNHQKSPEMSPVEEDSPQPPPAPSTSTTSPIANWKISSPGDNPEEVKARLKYWAQAVACTVRLCS